MPKKKRPALIAKKSMIELGVYKPEFEPVIEIYGQLIEQYEILTKRFIDSEYDFEESTAQGTKKAPIVTTLETLRKDVLAYATQLGLTPQGLLKANDQAFAKKKKNMLGDMLKELNSE